MTFDDWLTKRRTEWQPKQLSESEVVLLQAAYTAGEQIGYAKGQQDIVQPAFSSGYLACLEDISKNDAERHLRMIEIWKAQPRLEDEHAGECRKECET